jgi:hypothetical protein
VSALAVEIVLTLALIVGTSRFAGRLLGLHSSWLETVGTGAAGWTAGSAIALLLDRSGRLWETAATQLMLGVAFMMMAQLALESRDDRTGAAARTDRLEFRTRLTQRARRTVARGGTRRSSRIALDNRSGPHLGRRRGTSHGFAGEQSIGRRLRLTMEESGGMSSSSVSSSHPGPISFRPRSCASSRASKTTRCNR